MVRISILKHLLWLTVAGCLSALGAPILPVPPGIDPGDSYQLVFITAGTFLATSTDIADYNAFVTSEAAANPTLAAFTAAHGLTWTAIGSTPSISANVNAPSSGRLYTLDGALVASIASPLYVGDGSDTLLSPIAIDQFGNIHYGQVWTGNSMYGAGFAGNQLGSGNPTFGYSSYTTRAWEFYAQGSSWGTLPTTPLPFYALSSVITTTPEPGSIVLTALGGSLLFLARRRKHPNGAAAQTHR